MPICQTKFHGKLEYGPEQILQIPRGLFGFVKETEFLLLEIPSLRPLVYVQSVRTPNLCFLSLPAQVVEPGYGLELSDADVHLFGYSAEARPKIGQDLLCLALLTVSDAQVSTANLQAPLVIDIKRHCGMQVIGLGTYSHRAPVMRERLRPAC